MLINFLEHTTKIIYDHIDALIIINKDGIIEYSVTYSPEMERLISDKFVGKHILDAYPSLDENTSNHFKVMKTGKPLINERESIIDCEGNKINFVNSTFPIKNEGEIIGTIELSVITSINNSKPGFVTHVSKTKTKNELLNLSNIITKDPYMLEMKEKIKVIAESDAPVIIYGDTGTGKEIVAQSMHSHSKRANAQFVSINCSAIPKTLMEGVLFGSVRGGYTGSEDRKGLFEAANGGTVFLDELNSMDLEVQAKILKSIEDKKIRRIGADKVIDLDIRVISAMNEDPFKMLDKGSLRKDLFFRLGMIQLYLPPLIARQGDLRLLMEYFLDELNCLQKKEITGYSPELIDLFEGYTWPGNIRELKNALEHGFIMASGNEIGLNDIPHYIKNVVKTSKIMSSNNTSHIYNSATLKEAVELYEKSIIEKTLSQVRTNAQAAKILGVSKQALNYKIKKFNLSNKSL